MNKNDYNSVNWHEILVEDSSSPTFLRWKIRPAWCISIGDIAGYTHKSNGYSRFEVMYNKTSWYVHRVLWVMRNGSIDSNLVVDHIDGNGLNNSIENLRLVSSVINSRNQKQRNDNSSGVTGIRFDTIKGINYIRARWYNLSGKLKCKSFNCDKLGKETAFKLACEYREEMIAQLNESGAGYSERHGTITSIVKE